MMEYHYRHLPLDRITRKWWVFLLLGLLIIGPSYASRPVGLAESPQFLQELLSHRLIYWFSGLFPFFKLLPLVLIVGLWINPGGFTRLFHLYVSMNLLLVAFFENAGETPSYGFAILIGNIIAFGMLAALWGWEAAAGHAWLDLRKKAIWRYWVFLPALLAFLFPVERVAHTGGPNFDTVWMMTNEAGLTFCMIMPLYLAVLAVAYPSVNRVVMRISGFLGIFIGLVHMVQYLLQPMTGWWLAVMHMPLLVISMYVFVLSVETKD